MSSPQKTYRDFILGGELPLPASLSKALSDSSRLEKLWSSLWYNFLKNKGRTSTIYHLECYENVSEFNAVLKYLSKKEWIKVDSTTKRNWSEVWINEEKLLKFVTKEELDSMRKLKKVRKYILDAEYNEESCQTKINGKIQDTGLTREGFAKAGKSQFKFDIAKLKQYEDVVLANVHKSMDKMDIEYEMFENRTDYKQVCQSILDIYIDNPHRVYTTGKNLNDSRGRAISQGLKKVFNPISSKDARALLKVDRNHVKTLSDDGLEAVYLFIAELTGLKAESFAGKINAGMYAYLKGMIPVELAECWQDDQEKAEEARKDFHETIWLERIYSGLNKYHGNPDMLWDIPIELDGTASMLQIQGVLLNHETFLNKTNVINPDSLEDAWDCDGIDRTAFKKVATPTLYGSSATPQKLWSSAKYKYTREELVTMNRELRVGYLAVAQAFKEFIINNVKPKLKMKVKIWGEIFTIECNRYSNKGDYVQQYDVYDTKLGEATTIFHTITHREPDLQQFKRFFVTLLIHHLDSRVADYVCTQLDWIIPIHDAFIVHPSDATLVRTSYCYMLDAMYRDKEKILSEYFYSIGIDDKCAVAWSKVVKLCRPVENFKAKPSALK